MQGGSVSVIHPVILSGGSGSRLWPLSRESFPKQLLPLAGKRTLIQETALRVADPDRFASVIVVANVEHRFVIGEQLREVGLEQATIVLEPVARNTAPAIAVAATLVAAEAASDLLLVMPADHVIADVAAFVSTVEAGRQAAMAGRLVLFGIEPDTPATGYGYIQGAGAAREGAQPVIAFVEKPDVSTAEQCLASADFYWNSGILLFRADVMLEELRRYAPAVLAAAEAAVVAAESDLSFLRLNSASFGQSPSISIDHAVLERTHQAAVVPATFDWSDVGAWSALWEIAERDGSDNVAIGDILLQDSTGCYVRADGEQVIATVGVRDLIIIATPDAVLVADRRADQDVKTVVERLKAVNHAASTRSRRVYRPWGWYEAVHAGDRFQVKRITVKPGEKLSLQKHFHRAEHWVVVNGTAQVSVDGVDRLLIENDSIYIPLGSVHRLSNPGRVPLNLIEVQSGAYLGEDDIVRLDDLYARA